MAKYVLSCVYDDETKVTSEFKCDNIDDVVENFKSFLKGAGFNDKCVNEIRYGDEDMVIIKDRIKSAIDLLESMDIKHNNYYDLLKYLTDAYDT